MKVRVLVEHRYKGEPKTGGQTYDLTPDFLARQKIAEGYVAEVVPRKPAEEKKK